VGHDSRCVRIVCTLGLGLATNYVTFGDVQ